VPSVHYFSAAGLEWPTLWQGGKPVKSKGWQLLFTMRPTMPTPPREILAVDYIPADQRFEGADPKRWGGTVLRNASGNDVLERGRTVKLLPADWREPGKRGQVRNNATRK
jgi:hypothetical protein